MKKIISFEASLDQERTKQTENRFQSNFLIYSSWVLFYFIILKYVCDETHKKMEWVKEHAFFSVLVKFNIVLHSQQLLLMYALP